LSVRRQLEEPERQENITPRPAQLPLRILYIVSRPANTGFIDPRMTAKTLLDALDPLGASVRVDFCRPPTLTKMEEMLCDGQRAGDPYDIVHFEGHGNYQPEKQIGELCFEKPADIHGTSAIDFVSASRLGDLLASYAIPLVILEACRSATVGETAVFGSVAPRLIQAGRRWQRARDEPFRSRRSHPAATGCLLSQACPRRHDRTGRFRGADGVADSPSALDRIRPRWTYD
jgi:hypothetical protein